MSAPSRLKSWLHEPLLHFAVLGGLVFALDHVIASHKADPKVITMSPVAEQEARDIFRSAQGRSPTPAEMQILRDRWIANEVLYREGLAMRLDAGDPTVRERVIFKALNVLQSNLTPPSPDEKALRAWFDEHRGQYDEPARFDFLEAMPAQRPTEEKARQFAVALNTRSQSDMQSSVRIFKGRPRNSIVESFGQSFAESLEKLTPGEWHMLQSNDGARIIQLQKIEPGEPASFEAVQGIVLADWRDAKEQAQLTAAIDALKKKYVIQQRGTAP
jgi:PPIC-type PPIASE domain